MSFAILHISDMHFGRLLKAPRSSLTRRILGISEHSFALCMSLCDEVDKLRASYPGKLIVAVTGDQTTSANPAANEVVANFLNSKLYVSRRIKVGLDLKDAGHVVPGNHDKFLRNPFSERTRAEVYGEYFPAEFPYVKISNIGAGFVTMFGLDSNQVSGWNFLNFRNLNRHGEVGDRQRGTLQALHTSLRNGTFPDMPLGYRYDDSFKVVLLHHHLVHQAQKGGNSQLLDHRQLLSLFEAMDVDMVLCGHEHVPFHAMVGRSRKIFFSCAGSATKQDERFNSFKVYHFGDSGRIELETFRASSAGGLVTFLRDPRKLVSSQP